MVRVAKENSDWGYDRIVGAMANLGYRLSDHTVGNILQRHGIPPAPERQRTTTWADFIRAHLSVLAGTDFFSVEVLTLRGMVTYYVLFFLHLESRRVVIAGITQHPNEAWMKPCLSGYRTKQISMATLTVRQQKRAEIQVAVDMNKPHSLWFQSRTTTIMDNFL